MDWDYGFGLEGDEFEMQEERDAADAAHNQEMLEQRRWEEENDVQELLDNDPEYHEWANERDAEDLEAHIEEMAAVEAERTNSGLTVESWDQDPRFGRN